MEFSESDMAVLVDAFGTPGDALYAIQLEAQRRVSAMRPTSGYEDADRRVEMAEKIAAALTAANYDVKVWVKGSEQEPNVRVYVSRRGNRMGYIEVTLRAERNYNGLDRCKAGIRNDVESALASTASCREGG
jgi:hypothetical protein